MVRFIPIIVLLVSGCAQHSIQVVENADPVLRRTQTMRWRNLNEIEPIAFGKYRVASPDKRRTTNDGRTIGLTSTDINKVRREGGVDFELESNGVTVAQVSARTRRKAKRLRTKVANISYSSDDLLDGTIALASGQQAEFAISEFHSRSPTAKASGTVQIGSHKLTMRELDAPLIHQSKGFAGAEFFYGDQRVGQVIRTGDEHVWVDDQLPVDVQSAVAAISATLLITERLELDP